MRFTFIRKSGGKDIISRGISQALALQIDQSRKYPKIKEINSENLT